MSNSGTSRSQPLGHPGCPVCQGFGDLKNPRGRLHESTDKSRETVYYIYRYLHYRNVGSLLKSAKAGCGMCIVIREGLRQSAQSNFEGPDKWSLSESDTDAQSDHNSATTYDEELAGLENLKPEDFDSLCSSGIMIYYTSNEKTGPRGKTHLHSLRHCCVFLDSSLDWKDSLTASLYHLNSFYDPLDPGLEHRPSRDLLSEAHTDLITRWRTTCKEEHESCRVATGDQPLPSRVLVLSDPNNEESGVRLIETGGKMQGIYACLSYCWGDLDMQIGQTNLANLSRQQQGIAFKDLPSTIVDTIHLCYKLGFQYLWIDRLCIIQDDENDWSAEASRMCDIYSRSALTISVPICTQSSQSFLDKRCQGFQEQKQFGIVEYTDKESGSKSSFWVTADLFQWGKGYWFLEYAWDENDRLEYRGGNHWLRRGWTFQEWMLSPRVLHIDSITMWDCFDGYANEITRRDMEEAILIRNPKHFGTRIPWASIVKEYSERELTFGKDRLQALAGLAARYAKETGYTYLAGLWREEMPRTLLWRCCDFPLPNQRHPVNETAPSWSWARVNGPVEIMDESVLLDFSAKASIAAVHCRPKPSGSFSVFEDACVDVEGPLCVVTKQQMDDGDHSVRTGITWWNSFPDVRTRHRKRYSDSAIANGDVYLLMIGLSPTLEFRDERFALVLQWRGIRDGQRCYKRLGMASGVQLGGPPELSWQPSVWEGSWKSQLIRLI